MKISFDLSAMVSSDQPQKSIQTIFAVALNTLEKLDPSERGHVEVIKISYTLGRDAPVPHTLGCVVWTCVLNLNGKKTEVKMLRSSFYGLLYRSDDQSGVLGLNEHEKYIEKASAEFAGLIKESGRKIAEYVLEEAKSLCDHFDVEY